uniref:Transmembrane protein 198 n=1 Tax=Sorex araneus TaxID=42254 RepID=B3RF32_SORAR|nr:transmembrane protein 198 (predicted) [Sorex araneus]
MPIEIVCKIKFAEEDAKPKEKEAGDEQSLLGAAPGAAAPRDLATFASSSTLHGLARACGPGPRGLRRTLWALALLTSLAAFLYQAAGLARGYLTRPHLVAVDPAVPAPVAGFPAVTLCNINRFRHSALSDADIFHLANLTGLPPKDRDGHRAAGLRYPEPDMVDILNRTGHQLADMLKSCNFSGHRCSASNFSVVYTRYGKCYTFNADPQSSLPSRAGGMGSGLEIMLDIQQEEYLPIWRETSNETICPPNIYIECADHALGYRCFKAVLFLTGLLFGSVIIFLLCYRERVLETQLSAGASAGIALGIGLLCGLVAMLVRSVGLFLVGLLLGLLLAAAALLGSAPYYQPGSVWGPLGLLLGGGLLCALLTLRWPRPLTTLATAVTGAALIATAADYFAELLLLARYAVERLRAAPVPHLCWRSWALLALWPLLSLMGVLVQWRVTTERDSHTEVVISRQRRRVQLMRIRQQEERKEKRRRKRPPRAPSRGTRAPPRPGPPDPAYRRRPVPIKRFNGDVLSPSYIQSFRDRQTGSSLSSFMASPTEADYEYGSRGPLTACSGPPVRV